MYTEFIQVPQEVGGILKDSIGPCAFQFILTISAREQSHPECPGAA